MTGTQEHLGTGHAARWTLIAAMVLSLGCGERPQPTSRRSDAKQEPTSCRFTLGDETFKSEVCRFQFLPADAGKGRLKAFLQVTNFAISAETYPSLQLIAHVSASSPDALADQTVGAKAILLRAADADPIASKQALTVTFKRGQAPYLEGTFEGSVQATGSDKKLRISGEFRARPL